MRLRAWDNMLDAAEKVESAVTGKKVKRTWPKAKKKKRKGGSYSGKSQKGYRNQLEEADDY